jgi:D-serine deaminase-like pyridoxal phosphate-dependent protein
VALRRAASRRHRVPRRHVCLQRPQHGRVARRLALTVAATVVSRRDGRAIVDAGSKALSSERAADGFGLVLEAPDSALVRLDEEHGYVELAAGDDLELGQQVRVVPNHVCLAVNLTDELVAVRGGQLAARWRVERGR